MSVYLTLSRGGEFNKRDTDFLEEIKLGMLAVTDYKTGEGEEFYVMVAPSTCDGRTKIQTQWAFLLTPPKNVGEIIRPSRILTPLQDETRLVRRLNHIYTGQDIVARMLADMGARPQHYDRLRHFTEQFAKGVGRLANIDYL